MGVSPRDSDLLAPESRHNRHVTDPGDLRGVGDWSGEALYRAVRAADDPEADAATSVDDRVVSPEFGALVPAFDRETVDEDHILPPLEDRSESPDGTGADASG